MEVGVAPDEDGTVTDSVVSLHVVEDDRETIELASIEKSSVAPLMQRLSDAKPGEKLRIYLRANPGGNVAQLKALIEALARTEADVEIAVGRFAMSCAATLWLWFALDPVNPEGEIGEGRVVSVDPLKPAVLMYHKPRWPKGEYYCFIEDFKDAAIRQSVQEQVDMFDDLFYRLLQAMGMPPVHAVTVTSQEATYKHQLQHLLEAYESNKDCFITL